MKHIFLVCTIISIILAGCKKDHDNDHNDLNSKDRNFLINASYSNNDEVDAGNLASSQGSHEAVKIFGATMVNDHSTAETELKMLADSLNVAIPLEPDSAHKAMKQTLMSLSGMAFDTTYTRAQITDHQNTIALMQDEISNGQSDRVKRYANKYLPKVRMHLMAADSLLQYLQGH
jgi:putative membrane protein